MIESDDQKQGSSGKGKKSGKTKSNNASKHYLEISIEKIVMNPNQPRKTFVDKDTRQLAISIKKHGLLQPILVKPIGKDGMYQLVVGERRYRACKLIGFKAIPATVLDILDNPVAGLVENIQRKKIPPLEEATAIDQLRSDRKYTINQLGEILGVPRYYITKSLSLLKLPQEVKDECAHGHIYPKSLLQVVAKIGSTQEMLDVILKYKKKEITLREVRAKQKAARKTTSNKSKNRDKENEYTTEKFGITAVFRSESSFIDSRDVVKLCKAVIKELEV